MSKVNTMNYNYTFKDFRKFVEDKHKDTDWLDIVRTMYFLYDNRIIKNNLEMDEDPVLHTINDELAQKTLSIYLEFYENVTGEKYYSAYESMVVMDSILIKLSKEDSDAFCVHMFKEQANEKGQLHLAYYFSTVRTDNKYDTIFKTIGDYVEFEYLEQVLEPLFKSDMDDETALFLEGIK